MSTHSRPNYGTYPYKRTVRLFHSLQITACVLFIPRHMIVVGYYGFMLDIRVSVHSSVVHLSGCFSFPDENLSKRQWIFTKLGMCIDIVKIWFGIANAGFQAGPTFPAIPTFPYFFLCSYFSLLFSENALLSLLFSPKMFEVTKNCNFFPHLLKVCKNRINLI